MPPSWAGGSSEMETEASPGVTAERVGAAGTEAAVHTLESKRVVSAMP